MTSTGILHPKISNRFRVLYTVTANPDEDHDQIAKAMQFLSMQTVSVKRPLERFDGAISTTGPSRRFLKNISTSGDLEVVLEDDITHAVAHSIDFLLRRSDMHIEVQMLDGAESVIEVSLYGRCKLKSLQRPVLDYSLSKAVHNTLTFSVGYAQHGVLTPFQSQEL